MEKRIRQQRGSETLIAFDARGREVFQKRATGYEIGLTQAEVERIRGCTVTHNHPRGWLFEPDDPRHAGDSFSVSDVALACQAELREIRAIGPTRRFRLRPGSDGWSEAVWVQTAYPAFLEHEREYIITAGMPEPEDIALFTDFFAQYYDTLWRRVAKEIGWLYEREER